MVGQFKGSAAREGPMSASSNWHGIKSPWRFRVIVGMLIATVPVTILLAVLLTRSATANLTAATERANESVARAVTLRLDDWISERKQNLSVIAAQASSRLDDPASVALLTRVDKTSGAFDAIEVTDLNGRVIGASRPGAAFDIADRSWFRTVASGNPVLTTMSNEAGHLRWIVATPILGSDGRPEGVVAGDLNETALAGVLDPKLQNDTEVSAIDRQHRVIYHSSMGAAPDAATMIAAGTLKKKVDNAAVTQALTGHAGGASFTDFNGRSSLGGFDSVKGVGWAIVASQPKSVVLAPVHAQRLLAFWLVLAGAVLTTLFAIGFSEREAKNLRKLADDSSAASSEVNASAAELSASSEELAATTTQQSAAVTEASATTEELARASASIADTVDQVAAQASETRDNLEAAEADIVASSERTVALAERVNEIGAILTLINEIADQTNLLALNAAIEAARAGEGGRGFAVVAEEVRRLAERSKASAAEIASITEGVHAETNATVMAMEKGAKQMQQGLALLEGVAESTAQVRLTTQQQRSATTQVVETMDQLTDASRQVSATAQQLAGASASLVDLAGNLEHQAEAAKGRY